jgi:hypothetical protein
VNIMKNSTHPVASGRGSKLRMALAAVVLTALCTAGAWSQPTLSIDYQGPTSVGAIMDPGGVYRATPAPGPVPPPAVIFNSAALGIAPGGFGFAELDALSWGLDTMLRRDSTNKTWGTGYRLLISTDEFANGDPALAAPPDLFSEGSLGNREASADLQMVSLIPGQPAAPVTLPTFYGHFSWLDGDGVAPFGGLGVGLVEPNPPTPFNLPDPGDTIDAADFRGKQTLLYFSLDASWPDPLEGPPFSNAGTATANGVLPGDVLVSAGGGAFAVWASAAQLGLGPDDDLDALVLWENGNGVFDPSITPYDWTFGTRDMLLFSVRRGSPLVGIFDPFSGLFISEGDILTTPPFGPGTPPRIFIAAEVLGLGTVRNGTAFLFPYSDDLNALSIR